MPILRAASVSLAFSLAGTTWGNPSEFALGFSEPEAEITVENPIGRPVQFQVVRLLCQEPGGRKVPGNDLYLLCWLPHSQDPDWREPRIEHLLSGCCPKLRAQDLNSDGHQEVILETVAGAHTHLLEIYATSEAGLHQIGVIGSDASRFEQLSPSSNGWARVAAFQRDWSWNGAAAEEYRDLKEVWEFTDGRYRKVQEQDWAD